MAMYPEHVKLKAVEEASRAVSEFLEWLETEEIVLSRTCPEPTLLLPITGSYTPNKCVLLLPITESYAHLLARFFGIDPQKLENEKRAMLEALREGGE